MASHELTKWHRTVISSLTRQMTYKIDFLLTLIAPMAVFSLVSYSVWRSIYTLRGGGSVGNFSMEEMLHYQCWALISALLIRSHRSWNLSEDIRMGRISSFLLYPFELWKFKACEFIAFQIVEVFIATGTILTMILSGLIPSPPLPHLLGGFVFSLGVAILWFTMELFFGLLAFWLEETWVMRFVFNLFCVLLSGALIPIELFPVALQKALAFTPFPLFTSVPVHIFLGSSSVDLVAATATLCGWTGLITALSFFTWRKGLTLYSASGM
jgi:ABC-2 type transport system permease protein